MSYGQYRADMASGCYPAMDYGTWCSAPWNEVDDEYNDIEVTCELNVYIDTNDDIPRWISGNFDEMKLFKGGDAIMVVHDSYVAIVEDCGDRDIVMDKVSDQIKAYLDEKYGADCYDYDIEDNDYD